MGCKQAIDRVSRALEPTQDARDELIALGVVAAGIILECDVEGRQALVDTFCNILRKSVAIDLN